MSLADALKFSVIIDNNTIADIKPITHNPTKLIPTALCADFIPIICLMSQLKSAIIGTPINNANVVQASMFCQYPSKKKFFPGKAPKAATTNAIRLNNKAKEITPAINKKNALKIKPMILKMPQLFFLAAFFTSPPNCWLFSDTVCEKSFLNSFALAPNSPPHFSARLLKPSKSS